MAYTAQQLITRAWYLSSIVGRNAQTVPPGFISDGLFLLNALLNWKSIETSLIPYWTYYTFNAVANQEAYFIDNLYEIELMTFNDDVVRYPMDYAMRRDYFGTARVDNISSLPYNWTFNRSVGGGTIYMYFKPSDAFTIKLMGKFGLTNVELTTDMSSVYDLSYIEYLRYALAEYMCSEFGIIFNPQSEKILQKIMFQLQYVSPPDLSVKKISILCDGMPFNYADVNLGRGWRPS